MSKESWQAQIQLSASGVCVCELCGRSEAEFEDEISGKSGKIFCLVTRTEIQRQKMKLPNACDMFCPERVDIDRRISREATACAERIALYAKLLKA